MPIRCAVLGLPGAGKGTQAQKLADRYGVPHISMGDILRNNKGYETDQGETVGEIIDAGHIVPVDTVMTLLRRRVEQPDCDDGYVIDGFPRTREQADRTEELLDLDAIILLEVSEDNIYERLTGRRICPDCGDQYHLQYDPPAEDERCDDCGTDLVQREDDTRESIATRIEEQRSGMEGVLDVFDGTGLLERVDGDQSIAAVWDDVREVAARYA